MSVTDGLHFPLEVSERLRHYVYRLIDPRNGETFYVGRGSGNRVFAHMREELGSDEDALGAKLKRIREIRLAGLSIGHVIHRHGMDAETAAVVEAALIDAYPGLTNEVGGEGSFGFGPAHAIEIMNLYSAATAEFYERVLLISVNRTVLDRGAYEASRFAWRLDRTKAEQAEVVLAVSQGVIRAAFSGMKWLEATSANFPGRESVPGRWGFEAVPAPVEVQKRYVGKRVPDEMRPRGASNPIRYSWRDSAP
jgi:hypothetical protein